jgi:ligand-binding sensor domain-containing protein
VKSICEDLTGNLWIATDNGLSKMSFSRNGTPINHFVNYFHLPSDPGNLRESKIKTLYIDKKGLLWIGTWGEGLIHFNTGEEGIRKLLPGNFIQALFEDSKNNLFVATHNKGVLVSSNGNKFDSYSDMAALSFYEDRSGIMWMGTFINGVMIYDANRNRFNHYYNDPSNPEDLNDNFVYTILQDRDGELWVRTFKDGLNHFDRERKKVTNYKFDSKNHYNPNNNRVISLYESSDGTIWIGTQKGELYSFDKKKKKFTQFENPAIEEITAIFEDSDGLLWIGNNRGSIYNFHRPENKFEKFSIREAGNLVTVSGRITFFFETDDKSLWIGTLRDGLYNFNRTSELITHYQLSALSGTSINSSSVLHIYEDNYALIWIATLGGGVNKLNRSNNSFEYFTEAEGLPNNVVYGILSGNDGNLWISTNKGISRFSRKDKSFRNFDIKDGLQGNEFNNCSFFAGKDGELFFGGTNGFNSFYPETINDNNYIPPVYITKLKVFDEELATGCAVTSLKEIELSYSQNFFSFEFVALNYTLPEKNQYAYILDGFDKNWHYVTAGNRNANYTNIDPGKYVLRVKASNNDGVWNETGASLAITITPPFWMTWWFRAALFAAVAGIIIFIYNYRVSQLLHIERLRMRIASDLHDEIGSSLGSIVLRSRTLQKDRNLPDNSLEEIRRINRTAVKTASIMRDIVWFINPDFDTLDDMMLRMKDTAQLLLCDITYDFIEPEEIMTLKLPLELRRNLFLCYKEILHNISKHSRASKVIIKVSAINKNLELMISDDGVGFDAGNTSAGYTGNGLKNLSKRIR